MMRSMLRRTAVPAIVVLIAVVASLAVSVPAHAAGKTTLVLGIDISDTRTNDPSRQFEYSTPTTMRAVYETLITLSPGDYFTQPEPYAYFVRSSLLITFKQSRVAVSCFGARMLKGARLMFFLIRKSRSD